MQYSGVLETILGFGPLHMKMETAAVCLDVIKPLIVKRFIKLN